MYSAFYGPKRDFGRFGFGEAQASKVSLHWGGRFGVRESEELISGRISGGSENNDSGRLTSTQDNPFGTSSLSGPHPTPWSPM